LSAKKKGKLDEWGLFDLLGVAKELNVIAPNLLTIEATRGERTVARDIRFGVR
jgi:hypothetical protein